MDRAEIVHNAFLQRVAAKDFPPGNRPRPGLSASDAVSLFRSQCHSRALDLVSRDMQRAGQGYYTIGSSGHEGMAAVAHALRSDDIAFLHYRDGAFQLARAAQAGYKGMVRDMLLSFACAAEDPISGGRHKVLGSASLMIPPQTSTIASHLPKALGAAFSIGAARRNPPPYQRLADDALSMVSFGDASLNHASAQTALNAAGWTARKGTPLPLLFVCEDNGIGISTPTPPGWVADVLKSRPGLTYFNANGLDLFETAVVAKEAADFVRTKRRPAVLHLSVVRLFGHAGADVPTTYLSTAQVEAEEAEDPLLHSVRLLSLAGSMTPDNARTLYLDSLSEVRAIAQEVVTRPHLKGAEDVMKSIVPPKRTAPPAIGPAPAARLRIFENPPERSGPQTLARQINTALADLMLAHPEMMLMGQDIGRKGGVYGVTQRLQRQFGADRVIDTLLDETSILGLAIGMAHNGFLPVPEIQFLAYLHNAEDQLRGEAATLPFFSNGQFTNPMVVRIAGFGYQRGFGGHFHNDNSIAVLRDIPGLIIACPATAADAPGLLRECVRLARVEQRVVVFLEPIALYAMRDLHSPGDGLWMGQYDPTATIPLGQVGVHGNGNDLAIVTYGNGVFHAMQALPDLPGTTLVDLRWLAPVPVQSLLNAVSGAKHVLIVDECRHTGGLAEGLMAMLTEAGQTSIARHTARDSFIATGPAYAATLPTRTSILKAASDLLG